MRKSVIAFMSNPEDESWNNLIDNYNGESGGDGGDWAQDLKNRQEAFSQLASAADRGDFLPKDAQNDNVEKDDKNEKEDDEDDDEDEDWLSAIVGLREEDRTFLEREDERAEKARQMAEYGFDKDTIANTFDVALVEEDAVDGMQDYLDDQYDDDDVDLAKSDSHTRVEKDPETGEPIRSQMVYVDEVSCIGCTMCATQAGNTFYMNDEYGRARVFAQWGDDQESIETAIECCPVDCIHYVPFDELVRLEKERKTLTINNAARLVNSAEAGGIGASHMTGAAVRFSAPQKISGNLAPRCNNCPSRGCENCPMYGVGKNPAFQEREKKRKAREAKRKLEKERERLNKSAEL